MKPKTAAVEIECKEEYSTTENLYRLNEKIDQFISDIRTTRHREEKLIELFNLNRVKKIHSTIEESTEDIAGQDISVIEPKTEEDEKEEEMDSFLESWRKVRKDSDSFT